MEFKLPVKFIKKLSENPEFREHKFVQSAIRETNRYGVGDNDVLEVKDKDVDERCIVELLRLTSLPEYKGTPGLVVIKRQCETYLALLRNPSGAEITSLPLLPDAIIKYIQQETRNLLMFQEEQGILFPYLLTKAKYVKEYESHGSYHPACVDLSFSYIVDGEVRTSGYTFYSRDIGKGKTVSSILRSRGLFIETPENFEIYSNDFERWLTLYSEQGLQLLVHGFGEVESRNSWSRNKVPLTVEGRPTRCVVDTEEKVFEKKYVGTPFFDETCEDGRRFAPTHPYLSVYDLENHRKVTVHISQTTLYEYDKTVINKLVLKENHQNLINILTTGTEDIMEDIVKGKTGGIIIIATGPPGVGKTLTAEVYSEFVEKPLYIVQSSQLGITPVELEDSLKKILARANKWNAILLIDEADVFIHQRGDNIVQNAVVGVFLRVLEYYRGILFLTSNRRDIIDDAIRSRATAEIEYTLPDENDLKRILSILITQFQVDIESDSFVDEFIQNFCYISDKDSSLYGDFIRRFSGRDIKQILKLCNLISKRTQQKVNIDTVKYVIPFLNVK